MPKKKKDKSMLEKVLGWGMAREAGKDVKSLKAKREAAEKAANPSKPKPKENSWGRGVKRNK